MSSGSPRQPISPRPSSPRCVRGPSNLQRPRPKRSPLSLIPTPPHLPTRPLRPIADIVAADVRRRRLGRNLNVSRRFPPPHIGAYGGYFTAFSCEPIRATVV